MFSCARSPVPGIPIKIRATTNSYGPGHNVVKGRWRLGGIRKIGPGAIIRDSIDEDGRPEPHRVAINSSVYENKVLLAADPGYIDRIRASAAKWSFSNPEARAELLDIDGLGIPLLRQAIEDEYQRFHEEGGRLRENDSGPESGEAVKRRQMVKQVTVKSLVINAGAQFEGALRHLGRTAGLGEAAIAAIEFKPNLDFAEPAMPPSELNALMDAKAKGAPISKKSIHRQMLLRDLTDSPYDEEIAEIEAEQMDDIGRAPGIEIDDEAEDEEAA